MKIELDPHPEPPKPGANHESPPPPPPVPGFAPPERALEHPFPVPFEDEETHPSFLDRLLATCRLGYTRPLELAERIALTDRILPAWLFHLIMTLPFIMLKLASKQFLREFMGLSSDTSLKASLWMIIGALVVGVGVGIFITGVVVHLGLWVVGGSRHDYSLAQTIRVIGYGVALSAPVTWIPLIGPLIGMVWGVLMGIGLARTHQTETWRGVCAMLFPYVLVLCCCAAPSLLGISIGTLGGTCGR